MNQKQKNSMFKLFLVTNSFLLSTFSFSFKNRSLLKPQHDQGQSANPDWKVFVLQNMDATQLYKAVVCCALFSADFH